MTTKTIANVAVAVVLFGAVLRVLGMFSLELWSDEARWCMHLLNGTGTWFRPVGYMWLTRQIIALEVNEPLLRSLSTVAGIAQLPLFYVALRNVPAMATRQTVALLGTWLLAIHPVAVAMSKEFKPYAVEATLHTALVALTLLYVKDKSARWLAAVLVTSVIAPFFAWTVVFAYPGVFLVLGVTALRADGSAGRSRKPHFVGTALACAATLGVLIAMFFARLAAKKPATEYWGQKYDVFYVDDGGPLGMLAWFIHKTGVLFSFPAPLNMSWSPWLLTVVKVASGALCVIGIITIVRRKQLVVAALLLMPWLPMLVFNVAGAWPYGMFRTNAFMLFYTSMLVALGIDGVVELARKLGPAPRRAIAAVGVALFLATFPFQLTVYAHKGTGTLTSEASVLAAIRAVYEAETGRKLDAPLDDDTRAHLAARGEAGRAREATAAPLHADAGVTSPLLVLDGHACTLMRYYREHHAASRDVLHDWVPGHFTTVCGGYSLGKWKQTLEQVRGRSFWLIAGKTGWAKKTRKLMASSCEAVVDEEIPPSTHLYRCVARAGGAAPSPPGAAPRAGDAGDARDGADATDDSDDEGGP